MCLKTIHSYLDRCGSGAWASLVSREAESLIGLAQETVGIKEGVGGIFMDIRHILMRLETGGRFISEIKAQMEVTLERIPCSVRLLSIKGLGIVSVAGLIGEGGLLEVQHPIRDHEACRA